MDCRSVEKKVNTACHVNERDNDLTWQELCLESAVFVARDIFVSPRQTASLKATKADWDGETMECIVCSTPLSSHDSSQPKY